jgi:diguanylate cyclase (GGDEF)-like protein
MQAKSVRLPAECKILVVDDEKSICDFLQTALSENYRYVDTCLTGRAAIEKLSQTDYDLVISDLKLPDVSGIEVLRYAKQKDEYIEVLIITGYASIESASEAINLGVTSYLLKPLSLKDFMAHVEKAVGMRIFHLKSLFMMNQPEHVFPEAKGHLHDITSLYYFSRKLMLPLEISEIMHIILEEANEKFSAAFCAIGVNFLGFVEAYAMSRYGEMGGETVAQALLADWSNPLNVFDRQRFGKGEIPVTVFKGNQKGAFGGSWEKPVVLSMTVLGREIGFIAVYGEQGSRLSEEKQQLLYVFASMVSSIVEHGYVDMQAKLQAKTDSLTGVANHRLFHESLEREIARADRNHHSFCLGLIDIDDFKLVNDTHGHLIGDAVLIDLTMRISNIIRRGDVLARYGGEEFALILPDTDLAGAEILANRICREIASKPFVFSRNELRYTISIGLSLYDGTEPRKKNQLIADADDALYTSKRDGKNRVSIK